MPISRTTNPGIRIEESRNNPDFGIRTAAALQSIKQGPSGRRLLDEISTYSSGGKKTVTIRDTGPRGRIYTSTSGSSSSSIWPFGSRGGSASINWSPDQSTRIDSSGRATRVSGSSVNSFVNLGHELVHAKNIMRGTSERNEGDRTDPSTPRGREESRAIGLGEYYSRSPSENSIRAEHGLQFRTYIAPEGVSDSESEYNSSGGSGNSSGSSRSDSRFAPSRTSRASSSRAS